MRELWRHFWFAPAAVTNLALCRMVFFGVAFLFYLRRDISAWADVSPVFWDPIALFRFSHLPVPGRAALGAVQIVWTVALGLSCIGLYSRLSTAIALVLGVYVLGLPHNFGTNHHDALLVFVFGVLAVSRCGDGWSVDRWRTRTSRTPNAETPRSGEYTWPIRLIRLTMMLAFFGAGVSKLRHSGLEWITSDTLAILMRRNYYHVASVDPLTPWGLLVSQYPAVCSVLAAATVLLELNAPLAVVSRQAARLIVPGLLAMQIGIRLLMGVGFAEFLFVYVFWVSWDRLLPWFGRARS